MSQNLNVQNLDFEGIKSNLIDYMKNQQEFKDYDFTASSLNILMDVLAYNTHYMGFYAHMLANEAFIDSAQNIESLTSKAKLMNYVPGSMHSSSADVTFTFDINAGNEPTDKKIVMPRGTAIASNNNDLDTRQFILKDDLYIYNEATTLGEYDYTSVSTPVFEGEFKELRFLVNTTLFNQRFILRNTNIDISTLRVNVHETDQDSNFVTYKRADDFTQIDGDSAVYFIAKNEEGYYELFFGNNVYGKSLSNGNFVSCTFIATQGVDGNFASVFVMDSGFDGFNVSITTDKISDGGMAEESKDDLRFNIPYHYRRQNRCVTVDDYRNILLSEYRNINSISVWGGEDNEPKAYGQVFIAINPLYGEVLSSKSKDIVIGLLKRYNTATIEPIIVDPDYLYINLDVQANWNPIQTNLSKGQLQTVIENTINTYNEENLNKFGSYYSDATLSKLIIDSDLSVFTNYNNITLEKRFVPILHTAQTYYVEFVNPIVAGTVKSDEFEFRLARSYFVDDRDTGKIHIYYYDELADEYVMYADETFGEVNYETGQVRLADFVVESLYSSNGLLNVYSQPQFPDFFTVRKNILTIDDFTVTLTENYQNER